MLKFTKNQWITIIGIIIVPIVIAFWFTSNDSVGDTYQVSSEDQSGGITAGKIEINNTGIEVPFEKPDGLMRTFTFTHVPKVVVRDSVSMQKISSDGEVNWTGTNIITLEIAPNFDIYAQY